MVSVCGRILICTIEGDCRDRHPRRSFCANKQDSAGRSTPTNSIDGASRSLTYCTCHPERPKGVEGSLHYRFCNADLWCADSSTPLLRRSAQNDTRFRSCILKLSTINSQLKKRRRWASFLQRELFDFLLQSFKLRNA